MSIRSSRKSSGPSRLHSFLGGRWSCRPRKFPEEKQKPPAAEQSRADSGANQRLALMPFDHGTDRALRRPTPSRRATYRWPTCWPLAAGGVPLRVAAAALPGTATSQLVTPRSRAKAPVFISRLRVGSTVYTSRDRSCNIQPHGDSARERRTVRPGKTQIFIGM